ncbi:MAG: D-alanyl-D-alanine carboxypeptidase [Tildeniella nuda ZEHNDER 1965/U140]|nr:D-alanyl-D-alanine carboxypeptidase [Tildeniella nuda ZEHNDER 1965/U140]
MLELFSSGLVSLWLNMAGVSRPAASSGNAISALWQDTPWMILPGTPDTATQTTLQKYLDDLTRKGLATNLQGVWLQSGVQFLASNQGTTPLPAASLTKVATSLAALEAWGPDYQFETLVSATGPIQNGVLDGDLVVQGGGDPLLVWEEAIAVGNELNRLGVTKVAGNLVLTGNFLMNFETQPEKAGALLKQALNANSWSGEVADQYQKLPTGTPRPQVAIAGDVQVVRYGADLLPKQILLLRHRSLPLSHILKLMNIYSNNVIAESLANSLGGAAVVAQQAAIAADVPQDEIRLKNGSGLGTENQISPRAVCAMFATMQRYLQFRNRTIADLFPISGVDGGTIDYRKIPQDAVVKTGTLNDVSALAGVLPTRDRGFVWFVMINRGTDLDDLRDRQDQLLQALVKQWGSVATRPLALSPNGTQSTANRLGAGDRTDAVRSAVDINTYSNN